MKYIFGILIRLTSFPSYIQSEVKIIMIDDAPLQRHFENDVVTRSKSAKNI